MKKNAKIKMKLNPMLQMRRRCCGFAGYPGDEIKAESRWGKRGSHSTRLPKMSHAQL
jgi:hypothetical protein